MFYCSVKCFDSNRSELSSVVNVFEFEKCHFSLLTEFWFMFMTFIANQVKVQAKFYCFLAFYIRIASLFGEINDRTVTQIF